MKQQIALGTILFALLAPCQADDPQPSGLSKNFRLTISGKKADQSLGELSSLTCAPEVNMSGFLNASQPGTIFSVSGEITEQGEQIKFRYKIEFRSPVVSPTPGPAGSSNGPNAVTITFQDHSCSGSLLVKPGKAHEVLRSGGVIYTILLAHEE